MIRRRVPQLFRSEGIDSVTGGGLLSLRQCLMMLNLARVRTDLAGFRGR